MLEPAGWLLISTPAPRLSRRGSWRWRREGAGVVRTAAAAATRSRPGGDRAAGRGVVSRPRRPGAAVAGRAGRSPRRWVPSRRSARSVCWGAGPAPGERDLKRLVASSVAHMGHRGAASRPGTPRSGCSSSASRTASSPACCSSSGCRHAPTPPTWPCSASVATSAGRAGCWLDRRGGLDGRLRGEAALVGTWRGRGAGGRRRRGGVHRRSGAGTALAVAGPSPRVLYLARMALPWSLLVPPRRVHYLGRGEQVVVDAGAGCRAGVPRGLLRHGRRAPSRRVPGVSVQASMPLPPDRRRHGGGAVVLVVQVVRGDAWCSTRSRWAGWWWSPRAPRAGPATRHVPHRCRGGRAVVARSVTSH